MGFELSEEEALAPFFHQEVIKEEGFFHLEDRFDPKTGIKVAPAKVWDRQPKITKNKWIEINGERSEEWDPDCLTVDFKQLIDLPDCRVDYVFQCLHGTSSYVFYPHLPGDEGIDTGRVHIYNAEMPYAEVWALKPKLDLLRDRMLQIGWKVGEAKVFLAETSG